MTEQNQIINNSIHPTTKVRGLSACLICNNPCGAGVSSFCAHSIPHAKNKYCPIDVDCNCTGGGKIARCVPVELPQKKTTVSKYISFVKTGSKSKTSIWSVVNNTGNYPIGVIKWNGGWRQYCFFPKPDMVFSKGCMQDIITFIETTNKIENRSYGGKLKE